MTATPATPAPGGSTSSFRIAILSLFVVELFSGVIQVYFTSIYSELAERFHVGIATLSWSLTAFTLATVVFTPLFAKLGDVYGHSRVLKIEVAVVAVGSILIAAAPNFWVLVVGRALQGAFAAYLPLMFGMIRDRYDEDKTRRGVAYMTGILIFGVLFGAVIVSVMLKASNGPGPVLWLPAIGTVIGFALLFIRRGGPSGAQSGAKVDWLGLVLLAAGMVFLLAGLTNGSSWGWDSAATIIVLLVGAVLLAGWVLVDLRIANPLVDIRFLFQPGLVPVYLIGFFVYFGAIGTQVVASTFMALPRAKLGYGLGLTASSIGFVSLPGYVLIFLAVISTSRLGRAIGYRWAMFIGAACFFVGYAGLLFMHSNIVEYIIWSWIAAAGTGFIEATTRTIVVDRLREGEVAIGEGVYELAITIGGAVGSAVSAAILAGNLTTVDGTEFTGIGGFQAVWATCAVLGVIAAVVGLVFARQRQESGPVTPSPA